MRNLVMAVFAAVTLAACQTTSAPGPYSADNKPSVVTQKSIPETKAAAKAVFTRPTLAFKVVRDEPQRLLFQKSLPADVNDNNVLKDRTKGRPLAQIQLTFEPAPNGGTRVTGDNWMYLNPAGPDKDKFNLLATPDGARLQRRLDELK